MLRRAQCKAQSRAQSILSSLSATPLAAAELTQALGLESKTGSFKRTIKDLLEQNLIEYTIPDKPTSRLQKYRITMKGLQILKDIGSTKHIDKQ